MVKQGISCIFILENAHIKVATRWAKFSPDIFIKYVKLKNQREKLLPNKKRGDALDPLPCFFSIYSRRQFLSIFSEYPGFYDNYLEIENAPLSNCTILR